MVCSSVAKIAVRVLATSSGICFIVTQDIPSCVLYFLIFHSSLSVCLSVPLSLLFFSSFISYFAKYRRAFKRNLVSLTSLFS